MGSIAIESFATSKGKQNFPFLSSSYLEFSYLGFYCKGPFVWSKLNYNVNQFTRSFYNGNVKLYIVFHRLIALWKIDMETDQSTSYVFGCNEYWLVNKIINIYIY